MMGAGLKCGGSVHGALVKVVYAAWFITSPKCPCCLLPRVDGIAWAFAYSLQRRCLMEGLLGFLLMRNSVGMGHASACVLVIVLLLLFYVFASCQQTSGPVVDALLVLCPFASLSVRRCCSC